jgi:alkylation response protein AidB-like acyl-CoA dehydrogenase
MTTHPFVAAIAELGPELEERSARLDRSGEFVAENYRALQARKLFSAGIPVDLGGGGATHAQLCEIVRMLAHHCPSTALAFSMHTHLIAAAVWRHRHGQPAAPLLQKVAASELILVSTGAGDWLESTGKAERVEGGFRVTGIKRFASGSPAGNLVLTSAPYLDPNDGPTVLHFALPLNAEGVRVGSDWDTLGMRATGSHTLTIENAFVADAAISARRPQGRWHPTFEVICTVAIPIFMAAYVGLAELATSIAKEAARKRPFEPQLPYQLGELENALVVAQMAHREMVASAANYDFLPNVELANAALIRKTVCAEAVQRTVAKAVESFGGGAFFRKSRLEQLWRDAQGVTFHPLPEKKQHLFTGRVALGLPPA